MTTQARGLQPLSLTTAQRGALTAAQRPTGTIVYDNELDEVVLWNGASWIILGDGPGSLIFKGTINPTTTDPIADPDDGDFYISNASGNFTSNWGALAGLGVTVNDRIIFTNNNWANFPTGEATDLQSVTTQGATTTDTITVGGLTTVGTVDTGSLDVTNTATATTFVGDLTGDVTGDVTGDLTGVASQVAITQSSANKPILCGTGNNITDTSKGVQVPSTSNFPKIDGSTGKITASAGFVGNLTGTADNADTVGNLAASSFIRSDANDSASGNITFSGSNVQSAASFRFSDNVELAFGNQTDTEMFHNGTNMYLDINTGNFIIRDSTTTRFTFDDAGHFTATGNITANGTLNGTFDDGDFRTAQSITTANEVGTYGFLATNDSSNQGINNTKSGSNCRWSNAAANMTNQTPSGSWRQMGRVAGDSTAYGEKQSTLFLRYA